MKYKWLWVLVLLTAGGDIVTTLYGLQVGAEESNTVVDEAMEQHGELTAMIALKAVVIGVAVVVQHLSSAAEWAAPAALSTMWGAATLINLGVIATLIL